MSVRVEVRQHRICDDPPATIALPMAWQRLLAPGSDGIDEVGLKRVGSGIADPAALKRYVDLISPQLTQSRLAGATFGAMMAGDGDAPVAASLLVSPLRAEPTSVAQLHVDWLVAGLDREFTRIATPLGPALLGTLIRDIALDDVSSASAYEWQVAIPHPNVGGLLLAFATPLVAIRNLFDDVFLAIIRTVRWQESRRN